MRQAHLPILSILLILASASLLRATLPWTDAVRNPDGTYDIPWFGTVYDTDKPGWIYHTELGWLYAEGDSDESLYLYKPGLGWLWTGREFANYFYDYTAEAWIWHVPGTASPQWFYNFRNCRYIKDYMNGEVPADLSSVIENALSGTKVPAAACAVVRGGKIVATGKYGLRRSSLTGTVTASSKWEVASLTKSMTCLAAMRMVEAGLLDWDDTLGTLLPDIPMTDSWKKTTFQELIWHTSGINDSYEWTNHNPNSYTGTPVEKRLSMARAILGHSVTYTPGKSFSYSNVGYGLAGFVMEHVAGISYEDLIAELVYEPLGMGSAGFMAPARGDARDSQTWGHVGGAERDPEASSNTNCTPIAPAAGACMTINDLALYAAEHLSGQKNACTLITRNDWDYLHFEASPANPDYACGWYDGTYYTQFGNGCFFHEGYSGSFTAMIFISPEEDLAIVMAANDGNTSLARQVFNAIAAEVTTHYKEY